MCPARLIFAFLVLASTPAPGPAATLAYWRFEEGSGTAVHDDSGNGNTGAFLAAPLWSSSVPADPVPRTGQPNLHSLFFNGSTDALAIPDSPSLRPAGPLTIEAFIESEPGAWVLLGKQEGGGTANSWQIELRGGGPLNFILSDPSEAQHMCNSGVGVSAGVWHHVAATWDGASMRLYLDGSQICATPFSGSIGYDSHPVLIAADDDGNGVPGCCFFKGGMDEIRISDAALTPADFLIGAPLGVDGGGAAEARLEFEPPAPNPASGPLHFRFKLPAASRVRLAVQDAGGRAVRVLVDGNFAAGWQSATWDGKDEHGQAVAPGLYFVRLIVPGRTLLRRVALLR